MAWHREHQNKQVSGNNQNTHRFGVDFVIEENTLGNVMAFEPISERICYLRMRGKFYNISPIYPLSYRGEGR